MTNETERFFNDDPWACIDLPCYPEGRRLYLDDDRFWVSIDEVGHLVFFIHEEGVNLGKAFNSFSSVKVDIARYGGFSSRLKCTLVEQYADVKEKFAIVAKDVAYNCSRYSGKQLFIKALERIKSWSDFLKPERVGISQSEYLGFFGELYTLAKFVMQSFEPDDAIRFWVGPEQKKQDFTFNSFAFDVKSTMAGSANIISISSLDQLDKITDKLFLLRIVFTPCSGDKGDSLEELFNECLTYLESSFEARSIFLLKALELYGKASSDQLTRSLSLSKTEIYEVTENFPCITRSNVPSEIERVSYSIYASRLSPFIVEKDVKELITHG